MSRKWWVLLIEHDEGYRQVFTAAAKDSGLDMELFPVADGSGATNYLLGKEPYSDRERFPFPDLVFVDLATPGVNGFEPLKQIRKKLGLQDLPVIALSKPDAKRDVAEAYSWLASAVHSKPSRREDVVAMLRTVVPLWVNGERRGEK